ncbi:hypothetical protein BHE74_00013674, partial [Ensete ventricosum]
CSALRPVDGAKAQLASVSNDRLGPPPDLIPQLLRVEVLERASLHGQLEAGEPPLVTRPHGALVTAVRLALRCPGLILSNPFQLEHTKKERLLGLLIKFLVEFGGLSSNIVDQYDKKLLLDPFLTFPIFYFDLRLPIPSAVSRSPNPPAGAGDGPSASAAAGVALEDKEEPMCPPGLRQYETMSVLRPDMTEDERLALIQRYEELLVAGGGMYVEVFNRGVIPLAYSIKKKNKAGESNTYLDGIYLLFTYFTKPDSLAVLASRLNTDDDVIRSTSFKIRKRKY